MVLMPPLLRTPQTWCVEGGQPPDMSGSCRSVKVLFTGDQSTQEVAAWNSFSHSLCLSQLLLKHSDHKWLQVSSSRFILNLQSCESIANIWSCYILFCEPTKSSSSNVFS